MPRLTKQQRNEVLQLYEQGLKCEYIGALYGICRESVSKLALRRGATKRYPKVKPPLRENNPCGGS